MYLHARCMSVPLPLSILPPATSPLLLLFSSGNSQVPSIRVQSSLRFLLIEREFFLPTLSWIYSVKSFSFAGKSFSNNLWATLLTYVYKWIAIVFIDESVSSAAFSAFKIRNLPDKPQGTKGLGRIFLCMWNEWLHTTQIEAESWWDRDHFWEISTERENTHTGNWKLLLFFFLFFFAMLFSGFHQQDTIFIFNRNGTTETKLCLWPFFVDPEVK